MKKLCVFLTVILAGCFSLPAQVYYQQTKKKTEVGVFEIDIVSAGMILSPARTIRIGDYMQKSTTQLGLILDPEMRFNIPKTPLSVGLQWGFGTFIREWQDTRILPGISKNRDIRVRGTVMEAKITFDYNFRNDGPVEYFLGAAAGYSVSRYSIMAEREYKKEAKLEEINFGGYLNGKYFVCTIRGGVELFRRFRVTLFYEYINENISYCGLNFALTLGGN